MYSIMISCVVDENMFVRQVFLNHNDTPFESNVDLIRNVCEAIVKGVKEKTDADAAVSELLDGIDVKIEE